MNLQDIEVKARKMRGAGLTREDAQAWLSAQQDNDGYDKAEAAELIDRIYQAPLSSKSNVLTHIYKAVTERPSDADRDRNVTENVTGTLQKDTRNVTPLSERIEAWIKETGAWFLTEEVDRDLSITSPSDKENRRQVMVRLEKKGIVERHAKENKKWRYINTSLTEINFKSVQTVPAIDVRFPLELEQLVHVYPGNLIVVAGATNAGKTAMMLDFIYRNQGHRMPMYYFCSEMGDSELKSRLAMFDDMSLDDWNFKAIDRSTNFEDVIVPDCINIVDFLEMTEEMWVVNTHLTAICKHLGAGIAIVCIQKKVGEKWGRGQEFSAEKAKLYLSMDEGKLAITKGKSWAVRGFNPNGLNTKFIITDGCHLKRVGDWQRKTTDGYQSVHIPQPVSQQEANNGFD